VQHVVHELFRTQKVNAHGVGVLEPFVRREQLVQHDAAVLIGTHEGLLGEHEFHQH